MQPLQASELRASIVAEALTWIGTSYHSQAHLKGIGVDCIGLAIGVGKATGLIDKQYKPPIYSQEWHWHQNEELLKNTMEKMGCRMLRMEQRQPGDLLLFQFGRVCAHVAILVDDGMVVHAARDDCQVTHHILAGDLLDRLRGAYTFPGVA